MGTLLIGTQVENTILVFQLATWQPGSSPGLTDLFSVALFIPVHVSSHSSGSPVLINAFIKTWSRSLRGPRRIAIENRDLNNVCRACLTFSCLQFRPFVSRPAFSVIPFKHQIAFVSREIKPIVQLPQTHIGELWRGIEKRTMKDGKGRKWMPRIFLLSPRIWNPGYPVIKGCCLTLHVVVLLNYR